MVAAGGYQTEDGAEGVNGGAGEDVFATKA
jgi:hypothetical protein